MPFALRVSRMAVMAASLSMMATISGCGKKSENGGSASVQLKDLERADGTINDAMTDLDGVQAEGTAMAANDVAAPGAGNAAAPAKDAADNAAAPASTDEEVVADQ